MYILLLNKITNKYSIGYILGAGLIDAEYYLYTRSFEFESLKEVRKEYRLLKGLIAVNLEEDFKRMNKKDYRELFAATIIY